MERQKILSFEGIPAICSQVFVQVQRVRHLFSPGVLCHPVNVALELLRRDCAVSNLTAERRFARIAEKEVQTRPQLLACPVDRGRHGPHDS
jgi:hypothetical protein